MTSSVGVGSGGESGGEKHEGLAEELEEGAIDGKEKETTKEIVSVLMLYQ